MTAATFLDGLSRREAAEVRRAARAGYQTWAEAGWAAGWAS